MFTFKKKYCSYKVSQQDVVLYLTKHINEVLDNKQNIRRQSVVSDLTSDDELSPGHMSDSTLQSDDEKSQVPSDNSDDDVDKMNVKQVYEKKFIISYKTLNDMYIIHVMINDKRICSYMFMMQSRHWIYIIHPNFASPILEDTFSFLQKTKVFINKRTTYITRLVTNLHLVTRYIIQHINVK